MEQTDRRQTDRHIQWNRQKTDRLTDLGARHHNKRLHPRARVVALLFAEPRVNDVDDAING